MACSYPSKAIIDLDAYRSNLDLVRRLVGGDAKIIPVVKANAYGHGLEHIARAAIKIKPPLLAVATIQEGIALRDCGIETPVLVMSTPPPDALRLYIEYKLILMISDIAMAEAIGALARELNYIVPAHCKVDTGMGRQGVGIDDALEVIQYTARITHIDIQGILTHFPVADMLENNFTYGQIKNFKQLVKQIDKMGIPYEVAHAANSAAIVNYRESIFDGVRPGLITYGVWPTEAGANQMLLKRVLRWETRVAQLRTLNQGTTIGYGRTYRVHKPTKIAILPVGYADGFKYQLSNNADVLIRGKRCPVRGAVSMDQIVVDVSSISDVACGDVATLIGADGDQTITVEELAKRANTISYDILTGIGTRVHREYVGEDVAKE